MNHFIYKLIFLLVIVNSILLGSFNSSLHDKKRLAETYYESGLYDDAIIVYEEILEVEKNIFGDNNLNLLGTVKNLYELHLLNNNIDKATQYIQEYLNLQSSFIIIL